MHWHSCQLTILVHICYMWNLTYIANIDCGENKLLVKYHYFILDDVEHDTLFVQHCFEQHYTHFTTCGIYPNEHIVWSDGSITQFKSRRTWFHIVM
jgi:hypothetical protein